eukprot:GILI01022709.1.p1 GENE.GILI01022709.1~~GILI01022709.1.p1  ORF type:complete len:225 (-),score=39.44 GILI01022709.1:214-888(-)
MSQGFRYLDSPPGSVAETDGISPAQKKSRKRIAVFLGEEEEVTPQKGVVSLRRMDESNNTSNGRNSLTNLNQSCESFNTAERQELAASNMATYYTSMGYGLAMEEAIPALNTSGASNVAHPTSPFTNVSGEATRTVSSLSNNSGLILGRSSSRARRGSPAFLPDLVKSPPETAGRARKLGGDDSDCMSTGTSPSPKACPLPKPSLVAKKVKELLLHVDDDDDDY